jgi:dephospho-CoA kinase
LKKVGITGGIGSGKSVVGRILEAMNFPVYYSDEASKELVDTDETIRKELIALLGTEVYQNDKLNRPFLASVIFQNDEMRMKVNQIIHPKVREAFVNWTNKQTSPLVFNEAAILFETGAYKTMDATILVTAPVDLKVRRVIERDKSSMESVLERMSKQWSDDQKKPLADFVLKNDEETPLIIQIEKMLKEVSELN